MSDLRTGERGRARRAIGLLVLGLLLPAAAALAESEVIGPASTVSAEPISITSP